jgi:hypothetical protein
MRHFINRCLTEAALLPGHELADLEFRLLSQLPDLVDVEVLTQDNTFGRIEINQPLEGCGCRLESVKDIPKACNGLPAQ